MALPQLISLGLLTILVYCFFGVLGMDLLQGAFRLQCYKPVGNYWEDVGEW